MKAKRPVGRLVALGAIAGIAVLVLAVLVLRVWLDVPGERQVRKAFLVENPGAVVQSVFVSEGDFSAAYYHIVFTRPGDPSGHEVVWLYLKGRDGKWGVEHREVVR